MRRGRAFGVGGVYLVTFNVLGSTLPILPVSVNSVNQTFPSLSRVIPYEEGTSVISVNFSVRGSNLLRGLPVAHTVPEGSTRTVCLEPRSVPIPGFNGA